MSNHDMDDDTIKILLDNISNISTLKSIFFLPFYGEAMLHPKFYYVINKIKEIKPNIEIIVLTNGKLITEENLDVYKDTFKDIVITVSVLGNKENFPSRQSITGMSWNSIKEKIDLLNSRNIKHAFNLACSSLDEIEIALNDLLPNSNSSGVLYGLFDMPITTDFLLRCRDLNKKYSTFVRLNNGTHLYENLLIEDCWNGIRCPEIREPKCQNINEICAIDCFGNVIMCCLDYSMKIKFGNIKNDTILNIFNSNYLNKIRKTLNKPGFREDPCNIFCKPLFNRNKEL
jgi:sulfatase maturation enzyme AslB (radical SAM superfamily)